MNTALINAKAIKVTVWDENGNQFEYKFGDPKGPAGLRVETAYKVDIEQITSMHLMAPVAFYPEKREMAFKINY